MGRSLLAALLLSLTATLAVVASAPVAATAPDDPAATLAQMDGSGTADDPSVVTTVEELHAVRADLDAHYALGADVDARATADWDGGRGFDPIGSREEPFTGVLDGRNHTITGLTIDRPQNRSVGLIGDAEDARVRDLRLAAARVHAFEDTGLLIGTMDRGTVSSVSVEGAVFARETDAGGLVGQSTGTVRDARADVRVVTTIVAGGLLGQLRGDGRIERSAAVGDVRVRRNTGGGLVGIQYGTIERSYAVGTVRGRFEVGGLVGDTTSSARSRATYAGGTVEGRWPVGGHTGELDGEIVGSYAAADAPGGGADGGFVGEAGDGEAVAVQRSYWWGNASAAGVGRGDESVPQADPAGTRGAGATETLDGLDFEDAFVSTSRGPVLRWQVAAVDVEPASDRVGRGQSVSVSATAELERGPRVDVTDPAVLSGDSAVATVEDGELRAETEGVATIRAAVGDATAVEHVRVVEPTSAAIEDVEAPHAVQPGSSVRVNVTLRNDGGPGNETVRVGLADGPTTREHAWLESGEVRTVTAALEVDDAGGADERTLTVETSTDAAEERLRVEGGQQPTPGPGVAGAVVALAVGTAAAIPWTTSP